MSNKLTAKQKSFVEYYCNPNSETFNNQNKSALKAGYSKVTAGKATQDIVSKRKVFEAMARYKAELYQKQAITLEYIQSEHQRLAQLAEEKGDLPTATRNKELLGKTIAGYTDNVNQTSPQTETAHTESEIKILQEAARKLTGPKLAKGA